MARTGEEEAPTRFRNIQVHQNQEIIQEAIQQAVQQFMQLMVNISSHDLRNRSKARMEIPGTNLMNLKDLTDLVLTPSLQSYLALS
ncbi:hypothetical protein VTO42DRAFT_2643 [Malbranchea cinnamomea]